MIVTRAKAETREQMPAFLAKFQAFGDMDHQSYYREVRAKGYTHFVEVSPRRVTVGDLTDEYRILNAIIFFKGEPPAVEALKAGVFEGSVEVEERLKFYSNMILLQHEQYRIWCRPW